MATCDYVHYCIFHGRVECDVRRLNKIRHNVFRYITYSTFNNVERTAMRIWDNIRRRLPRLSSQHHTECTCVSITYNMYFDFTTSSCSQQVTRKKYQLHRIISLASSCIPSNFGRVNDGLSIAHDPMLDHMEIPSVVSNQDSSLACRSIIKGIQHPELHNDSYTQPDTKWLG